MTQSTKSGKRPDPKMYVRILTALLVVGCAIAAWKLPLWQMKLTAPMYPNGLTMVAYGDSLGGDLRELNIVNHYVGMKHITTEEFGEMALFPVGLIGIILLGLIPVFLPRLRFLCAWLTFAFPIVILAFIQYYLYKFGHGLNPDAPFKIPEFMPVAIGSSTIVNFTATSMISWGLAALILAALFIGLTHRLFPVRTVKATEILKSSTTGIRPAVLAIITTLTFMAMHAATAQETLQDRLDQAQAGQTIVVAPGVYAGPITISKPLTVIGQGMPEIRGDKKTDVVSITSSYVTFTGFRISLSGTDITSEAAGIRAEGNHIRITDNVISQVYFGIHILSSDSVELARNTITPGQEYAGRPGHAVNIWSTNSIDVTDNIIDDARDGILLTYTKNAVVTGNTITRSRYGLHSMYSQNVRFENNHVRDNLLGLALMYSKVLIARSNTVLEHRRGSSPYGFLLKDIDNVTVSNNVIQANQVGIFAEGISMELNSTSTIADNIIAANMCGVSVQSNAAFSFVGNMMIENMSDVQKQTDHINSRTVWDNGKLGNYWSSYRGYDRDGDDIGDLHFQISEIPELDYDTDSPAQALLYTPGYLIVESAIKMFPLLGKTTILEDRAPLMHPQSAQRSTVAVGSHSYLFSCISALSFAISLIAAIRYRPFSRLLA